MSIRSQAHLRPPLKRTNPLPHHPATIITIFALLDLIGCFAHKQPRGRALTARLPPIEPDAAEQPDTGPRGGSRRLSGQSRQPSTAVEAGRRRGRAPWCRASAALNAALSQVGQIGQNTNLYPVKPTKCDISLELDAPYPQHHCVRCGCSPGCAISKKYAFPAFRACFQQGLSARPEFPDRNGVAMSKCKLADLCAAATAVVMIAATAAVTARALTVAPGISRREGRLLPYIRRCCFVLPVTSQDSAPNGRTVQRCLRAAR